MTVSEAETQLLRLVRPRESFWHGLNRPLSQEPAPEPPFIGLVQGCRFKFNRHIEGRNSFLPVISGRITPADGRASLELTMRIAMPALTFMAGWLGSATYAAVQFLEGARSTTDMLLGLSMPLFGIALIAAGFIPERRKAARILCSEFGATTSRASGADYA